MKKELNHQKEKQHYQKFSYKEVIEELNKDKLSEKYNLIHKIVLTKNKSGYQYKCVEKQNAKAVVFEKYLPSTEQTIIKMAGLEAFKKVEELYFKNDIKPKEHVQTVNIEDAINEREKRLEATFIGETPDDIKFIYQLVKEDQNESLKNKLIEQISQIKTIIEKNDFRTEYYRRNDGEINVFVINRNGKELLAEVVGFEPIAIDVAVERFEKIKNSIDEEIVSSIQDINTIGSLFPDKADEVNKEKYDEDKALSYQNAAERLHDKFGHPKLLKTDDHSREEFGEAVLDELKCLGHALADEASVYISPDNKEIKVFVESNDEATNDAEYILKRYLRM